MSSCSIPTATVTTSSQAASSLAIAVYLRHLKFHPLPSNHPQDGAVSQRPLVASSWKEKRRKMSKGQKAQRRRGLWEGKDVTPSVRQTEPGSARSPLRRSVTLDQPETRLQDGRAEPCYRAQWQCSRSDYLVRPRRERVSSNGLGTGYSLLRLTSRFLSCPRCQCCPVAGE